MTIIGGIIEGTIYQRRVILQPLKKIMYFKLDMQATFSYCFREKERRKL
jgi:hypothetical protein